MKIYIAAPWAQREAAIKASRKFIQVGHEITSRWFNSLGDSSDPTGILRLPEDIKQEAYEDIEDVHQADYLVVLNLQLSEGKAVETGLALAWGIPVISIGPRSNIFQALGTEVSDVEEAIEFLRT